MAEVGFASSKGKDLFSCKEKVVVVTGAARGLGLNFCNALAQQGAHIAGVDIVDQPHEDFAKLADYGIRAKYYKSDVTSPEAVEATIQQIAADFGEINCCVPAAGVVREEKEFVKVPAAEMKLIMDVNVLGVFFTLQSVVRQMVKQGKGGSIACIASVSGHQALPTQMLSAYNASKFAVRGLAMQIAREYAEHGIRVNSISPGPMLTDMTKILLKQEPQLESNWTKSMMIKRLGRPDELNGAVVYLLSEASSFVTAEDIIIDGGMAHN